MIARLRQACFNFWDPELEMDSSSCCKKTVEDTLAAPSQSSIALASHQLSLEIVTISGEAIAQIEVEASLWVIELKGKLQDYMDPGLRVETLLHDGDELQDTELLQKLVPHQPDDAAIVLNAVVCNGNAKGGRMMQIFLADGTAREVPAFNETTLQDLADTVAETTGIHESKDFRLFQCVEGLDAHRLLPGSIKLGALLEKWEKLDLATGRKSSLLWKRFNLRPDETLRKEDPMHAELTYQQVISEYLNYPMAEQLELMITASAYILYSEYDRFAEFIANRKLHANGILEQLLPGIVIRRRSRREWSTKLLEAFDRMPHDDFADDSVLQRRARVLANMQRFRLFGAYHWYAKQAFEVPADKRSMSSPPALECQINPRDRSQDFLVCIDTFGIRFVSVDDKSEQVLQRGFLFNNQAVERVLSWSAKQDILEIAVQSINPAAPGAGLVPMAIAIQHPAAIDLAYVLSQLC